MVAPVLDQGEVEVALRYSWSRELWESHDSGWATKTARQEAGIGWGDASSEMGRIARNRRRRGIRVRDGETDPKAIPEKGEERRLGILPIPQSYSGTGWVGKMQGEKEEPS